MDKKRLVLGVTIGGSSRLLDGQAAYFKQLGYEVYLISQDHIKETLFCEREGITHLPVTIDNQINPLKDVIIFQGISLSPPLKFSKSIDFASSLKYLAIKAVARITLLGSKV